MGNLQVPVQVIALFLNEEGEVCSLCGALPDKKCKGEDQTPSNRKEEKPEFSPFV